MRIYNTLTKKVDDFAPLKGGIARVYSCGPTVYNNAHIGNLTAYIYSDILQRALLLGGFKVQRVMNFTDIDDKTIVAAQEKYPDLPAKESLKKLTRHFEKLFLEDMTEIGNDTKSLQFVRASESITEIQNLIQNLVKFGVAYTADDGVYFNIAEYSKKRKYGQLSHVDAPAEAKARIDNDEYDKESARDFALWKKQKTGEPAWDFEIDGQNMAGRPGWHIECSAMSVRHLGQPFDIHTGGVDHIFPHHENEIAQSTAGSQPEVYARFFFHNEHLLVDGAKMSKSKNNFYTLADIVKKSFSPLDFRMLILQSHYQTPSNFSWENLTAAHNRLKAWRNLAELRWQVSDVEDDGQQDIVKRLLESAKQALLDNLNTPETLKYIDQSIDEVSKNMAGLDFAAVNMIFDFIDKYLGIKIYDHTPDIADSIKELIVVRQVERANGNYGKSDEIREALSAQGVEIKDVSNGVIWSRK
ncbi:MAG: cysteine--tRNA ligase [Candidatus Nomurabacteria bacterium]|jgi:cysteinyl-tRNA synthetase|nr:cysteine--tRNA ligase [Candidatus Nomurabacteria bacterium]